MSREIKFRVWGTQFKQWIYPSKPRNIPLIWLGDDGVFQHSCLSSVSSETAIIEQYTGLKDSEGKEIYEGDIVDQPYFNVLNGKSYSGITRNVVEWMDESGFFAARWCISAPNVGRGPDLIGSKSKVIGNIHQHSHLLTPTNL